jgi:hypothetical protein
MPSIQTAVRGLLNDQLDLQLEALWQAINDPGFEPPAADPLRVAYQTGSDLHARPIVLTDVLRQGESKYVKPLMIGLANRHNVVWDLATARLVEWSVGDCAGQHTEGKTWYWRAAGEAIVRRPAAASDWSVRIGDELARPETRGQFVTELDHMRFDQGDGAAVEFAYRLHFAAGRASVTVNERLEPWQSETHSGWRRHVTMQTQTHGQTQGKTASLIKAVGLALLDGDSDRAQWKVAASRRTLTQLSAPFATIEVNADERVSLDETGHITVTSLTDDDEVQAVGVTIHYHVPLHVAPHAARATDHTLSETAPVDGVPGFDAVRLPLREEVMPTALAWGDDNTLYLASLKGRVWRAWDADGDGYEDRMRPISPELAAPYGLSTGPGYVDVLTKHALLRLLDDDRNGDFDQLRCIASGWGHTDDYHDWAVGLCRDTDGNYYLALPCQQDDRSAAAANLRGTTLQLVAPSDPDAPDARFTLQEISRGHRFPMGIARNRQGLLVVTDNQGNYNPFNELNVVERGRHFGFINRLDRGKPEPPEVTEPAIAIPHPWTRSVNGICFLESPHQGPQDPPVFGPFEGHLVGCEYDTRRLIRMTIERVDGIWQGAAYPMSRASEVIANRRGLLGPICCAVAPDGTLYIGGIRDSGWGGANNVGEVVRLRFDDATLPCGIQQVRATQDGFELTFTRPVDAARAGAPDRYTIHSYYRVRTPAYGGDDHDRRRELVTGIALSEDGRRARLTLERFEAGRVYEFQLQPLTAGEAEFFPAEAHYTLRRIPGR